MSFEGVSDFKSFIGGNPEPSVTLAHGVKCCVGGRRYTRNEIVSTLHQYVTQNDLRDPGDLEFFQRSLRVIQELDSNANIAVENLSFFKRVVVRIRQAIGNFFYAPHLPWQPLKRERELQEIEAAIQGAQVSNDESSSSSSSDSEVFTYNAFGTGNSAETFPVKTLNQESGSYCFSSILTLEEFAALPVLDLSEEALGYDFVGYTNYPDSLKERSMTAPIMRGVNGLNHDYLIVQYSAENGSGIQVFFDHGRKYFSCPCHGNYGYVALDTCLQMQLKKESFGPELGTLIREGELRDENGKVFVRIPKK